MEISGKRLRNYCQPCERLKTSTFSEGFCSQCAEEMCQRCFDTHKHFKLNQGHRLVQSVGARSKCKETPTFDNCIKHLNEDIKFFCPKHDQVGCGDCMVISHKTCKVEYILEHIDGYKDSKEFTKIKKDIEKFDDEAETILGRIRSNKDHLKDVNKTFALNVKSFRDKMIAHITKLSDAMLNCGDDIMAADMKKIKNLEKENRSLVNETNDMRATLQSEADRPYKLFITSLSYRQNLHLVQDQLERIKANNKIETYDFMPDCNLEQLMKTCKQLGVIHKQNESGAALREETVKANKATPVTKALCSPKDQPLLNRQRVCKNLIIDGDLISYDDKAGGQLGLFIDTHVVEELDIFKIEIVSIGRGGSIAIGVVPNDYPNNLLPGLGKASYGYDSDGKVFIGSKSDEKNGDAWKVGDRIKCEVYMYDVDNFLIFTFKHNGKVIGSYFERFSDYHFAVGMKLHGDKIKIIKITSLPET